MPCVQRSWCLNEVTDDFGNIKVEVPKGVGGRTRDMLERCMATCGRAAGNKSQNEIPRTKASISSRSTRILQNSFAEAKTFLEYRSWVDKHVTGRWVLTTKTDKQGNFLRAKARWVLRGFQDKTEGISADGFPTSTRPRISDGVCQMAASKSWNIFSH